MVAEFTVVRDGTKNWIGMVIGATDRAFRVDAATNIRTGTNSVLSLIINTSNGVGWNRVDITDTMTKLSVSRLINHTLVVQDAGGGAANLYYTLARMINTATWTAPTGDFHLFGLQIDMGATVNFGVGANVRTPNVYGLDIAYDDVNTVVAGGTRHHLATRAVLHYRVPGLDVYSPHIHSVDQRIHANVNYLNPYGVFSSWLILDAGVNLTVVDWNTLGNYIDVPATSTITGNLHIYYLAYSGQIKGTVTGNISLFNVDWQSGATATCNRLTIFDSPFNISGMTTITTYAAVFNADINANNKAFTVYGSRVDIDGTIGANATWRGHYLNTDGVTCGVGRTLFGIQLDMDGMTSGGSIAGYNVNQLPANSTLHLIGTANVPIGPWSVYNASNSPNFELGPDLLISVKKEDNFTGLTWGATGVWAVGQKWRATIAAGGSVTLVSPAAGGIVALFAPVLAGPNSPTFLDENNILGWRLQERPVLYTRWRVVQDGYIRAAVGWTDDVAEGIADPMPYTSDAVLAMVDTAVGAFFYLVGVRATVRVDVSSGVALDTNHHRFMIIPKYTTAGAFDGVDLFMDDIYRCSLTAAQCPVETTMMQCLSGYVQNLAVGAADKHQRVDKATFGELTNVGLGDT